MEKMTISSILMTRDSLAQSIRQLETLACTPGAEGMLKKLGLNESDIYRTQNLLKDYDKLLESVIHNTAIKWPPKVEISEG